MAKRNPAVQQTTKALKDMHRRGVSEREIARRTGLGKSSVHDVLTGKQRLKPERAVEVTANLDAHHARNDYSVPLPDKNGDFKMVEGVNEREINKLVAYKVELYKYFNGEANDLHHFDEKSIHIVGKTKAVTYKPLTDESVLRKMLETGKPHEEMSHGYH